jgi:hypothetical protein
MILIAILFAVLTDAQRPAVVARYRDLTVSLAQIQCHVELVAADMHGDLDRATKLCPQIEHHALIRLLVPAVLDHAASLYPIEPSRESIERLLSPDQILAQSAAHQAALARAQLRFLRGESMDDLRKLVLEPEHISALEFESFSRHFKSTGEVEVYLKNCTVDVLRRGLMRDKRYELLAENLSSVVKKTAANTGKPFQQVAEEVWSQLIDGPGGIVIFDPSLSKPDVREVLTP